MAAQFLQQHHLYLTPLSPLHLGTGEDYQPTEYVISDGIMYVFDPAQATLSKAQYDELMSVAQGDGFIEIQKYFKKYARFFQNSAYKAIGVSRALEKEYNDKLGETVRKESNGEKVHNQLTIERTAVNPLTHQPYIPGSAFKGSVRTALLEQSAQKNAPTKILSAERPKPFEDGKQSIENFEQERFGSFSNDIMRLLKIADFMPFENSKIVTQVQYSVNRRKYKEGGDEDLTVRREMIQHGQYRAFFADCTLQQLLLEHKPKISKKNSLPNSSLQPLKEMAIAVNKYSQKRWQAELQILEQRNLVNPVWLKQTALLLADIKPQLDQGQIMLMRLGKNGGLESKTLSNYAQESSESENGKDTPKSKATTIWLAAQSKKVTKETHGLLPFGWVLIEIDPQNDNAVLKQWCERNSKHLTDTAAITAALAQQRQQAAECKQMQEREQQRIEQEKQAAEAEKQRQAAALAAMPPEERLIAEWQQKLSDFKFSNRDNQQIGNELYQAFSQALQQAAQDFDAQTQKSIAEAFSWGKISKQQPGLFAGKREKEIKALLRQLRGE